MTDPIEKLGTYNKGGPAWCQQVEKILGDIMHNGSDSVDALRGAVEDLDRRVAVFDDPERPVEPQSCVDDDGTFEMPREEWEAAKAMEFERNELSSRINAARAYCQQVSVPEGEHVGGNFLEEMPLKPEEKPEFLAPNSTYLADTLIEILNGRELSKQRPRKSDAATIRELRTERDEALKERDELDTFRHDVAVAVGCCSGNETVEPGTAEQIIAACQDGYRALMEEVETACELAKALNERDELRTKLQDLHRDVKGICEDIPLPLADAFTEALKRFPVEGPAPDLVWRDECVAEEDGIYLYRKKGYEFRETGWGAFFDKGDLVTGSEGGVTYEIAGPIPEPREPDDVKEGA